ncbi:hypothetical protein BZA70DRAFT_293158 [Myxozyma melibiosi]|uniref:Golgi apparatus membrane protein TVP38 n=1 Tax=Myxozyma melibiosi TaxID=54550 RepID=A0ABR1FDB6_9ASCO
MTTEIAAHLVAEEADLLMPPSRMPPAESLRDPEQFRRHVAEYVRSIPPKQRILGISVLSVLGVVALLLLIFHKAIFGWIQPFCESWSNLRGGTFLMFLFISATSFPPIVGYTSAVTIAGLVYGLWRGWIVASISTVIASYACFVVCRVFFADFAFQLAQGNQKFEALAMTLDHEELKLLWMIRMSPLPFSFSNAALSTIHTISPKNFAIATALSTPKLLIPVFIGSRLRNLTDESQDWTSKLANIFSILFGAFIAASTGWIIYHRTMDRARLIQDQLDHERELREEPMRFPRTAAQHAGVDDAEFDVEQFAGQAGGYSDEPPDSSDDEDAQYEPGPRQQQRQQEEEEPLDGEEALIEIAEEQEGAATDGSTGEGVGSARPDNSIL